MVLVNNPIKILGKSFDDTDTPTDGQVLTYNSSSDSWDAQDGGGGGGITLFAYKTADESVGPSDTTLQADDHLVIALEANKKYGFLGIHFLTGDTAGDFKFQYSGPSGATGEYGDGSLLFSIGSGSRALATSGNKSPGSSYGWIETAGTAGNLTLNWAQQSAHATSTVQYQGSYLLVWEAS